MGHNLSSANGRTKLVYTGATPWHGLGTKVENALTSEEAIIKAGLNWSVNKKQIQFNIGTGIPVQKDVPGHFATVRSDTQDALGVVGSKYRVLQNAEAFKFFDSIVGEKLACFHTVGALGLGEKIWLLAKLPGDFWVTKDDQVEKYLLLTNSHDGSSAVQILATPIRVVCQNTLNIAIRNATTRTSVRHTLNIGSGIREIREQLGLVDSYYRTFEELSKSLVSQQANSIVVEKVLSDLGLTKDKAKESTRTDNIRYEILKQFESGRGNRLQGVAGTKWALFNGVVEWVDYFRSARGASSDAKTESRTSSLLFGSGAQIKQQTLDTLLKA